MTLTATAAAPPPFRSTGSTSRRPHRRSGTRSPGRNGPRSTATAAESTTTCDRAAAFRSMADAAMQQAGMPECVVDGEVIESDPPNRLVQTWRAAWTDDPPTTLTYDIAEKANGVTCLTITHDLDGAPATAAMVGGIGRRCRRRLGRGDQRPEDPAGDRQLAVVVGRYRILKRPKRVASTRPCPDRRPWVGASRVAAGPFLPF